MTDELKTGRNIPNLPN